MVECEGVTLLCSGCAHNGEHDFCGSCAGSQCTVEADAWAKANRKLASSLTRPLVDYKAIEKWTGSLPQVSGGATPFINLK